jgi:hypothetical protein
VNPAEQIREVLRLDRDWRIVVEAELAAEAEHLCPGIPGPGGMPLSDWIVLRSALSPDGRWRIAQCPHCKTLHAAPVMH